MSIESRGGDVTFVRRSTDGNRNGTDVGGSVVKYTIPAMPTAPLPINANKGNFIRRLFQKGKTAPVIAAPVTTAPVIYTAISAPKLYKERYEEFMHKTSGMIYYIVGIIVSFVFIIVGSVLMNKMKSSGDYNSTTIACESGNCYATTDGDGQIILTDADKDPNMNDRSSYMTGMILLLFGIACACLTLILYFRKK
jgi:hypothetical protein